MPVQRPACLRRDGWASSLRHLSQREHHQRGGEVLAKLATPAARIAFAGASPRLAVHRVSHAHGLAAAPLAWGRSLRAELHAARLADVAAGRERGEACGLAVNRRELNRERPLAFYRSDVAGVGGDVHLVGLMVTNSRFPCAFPIACMSLFSDHSTSAIASLETTGAVT